MNRHTEIAVHTPDGQIAGVIELSRAAELNSDGAAEIFKEHVRTGALRGVRFLLLVTVDRLFLWDLESGPPGSEVKVRGLALPRFLAERLRAPVSENVMLLATYEWLVRLSFQEHDAVDPAEAALYESGFLPLLEHARFKFEPAA